MPRHHCSLLLVAALVHAAACHPGGGNGGDGPTGPVLLPPPPPSGSTTVTIHGILRAETDSTPVAGATLAVFRITDASSPDVRLASATSGANGTYTISFLAECNRMYGLKVDYPHPVVSCSRCPVWPLPAETCSNGDWPLDLWVQG
jgi:hypothetical protein